MHRFLRTSRRHRGVSLLEVLISIGVTSVGLLGVMSLIPLAGAQARKGQISERSIVIGLAGVGELNARGMLDPNNWLEMTANGSLTGTPLGRPSNSPQGLQAVCIDPRGLLYDLTTVTNRSTFPMAAAGATVSMKRVSLRNVDPSVTNPVAPFNSISKEFADYIFQSQDDLSISLPSDRALPPYQIMAPANDSADDPEDSANFTRRQFEGNMSWMATLVPKALNTDTYNADLYTASIVVFHSRQADVAEQVANVTFNSAGIAGGEITITSPSGTVEYDVRSGSWIMLAGQTTPPYYRWYRVLDASDKGTEQHLTLQGPDWGATVPTQAVIVPGVVAVYEKTVRLDTPSLWSN